MSQSSTGDERLFALHYPGASLCGKVGAGHDLHWIQATRTNQPNATIEIHDVSLMDQTTVLLAIGTNANRRANLAVCRNHNAEAILAAFHKHREGRVLNRTRLLQIGPATGAATFSVTGGLIKLCPDSRPFGAASDACKHVSDIA